MPQHHRAIRTTTAALPAAIVGSLALSLTALPAHAASVAERTRLAPTTGVSPATVAPGVRPAGATTAAAAARRAPATHRVVRGDTVYAIAKRYGLPWKDVLAWNRLGRSAVIHPGQVLRLTPPSGARATTTAKPKAAASTTKKPAAPKTVSGATYTVRSGDTVSAIARRHGRTTQAVLNANHLRWSSVIFPGQKLVIPGTATAAAATKAPAKTTAKAPVKAAPAPKQSTAPASADRYTVRAGDTMSDIAARHGVSVTALLQANGMDWNSIIYPGQLVRIPSSGIPGLTTEQAANARLIVRIGKQLGVPARGLAIALGTAMQESGLRNLDYGDRDSLGLFQQRPSTGWGTAAQVRDADRAVRAFFGGPGNPNAGRTRGLLDIGGWQNLEFTEAAQAVQVSAYPNAYAQWEKPAYAWLAAIG
ncbi:LysM peptidoglycan-binding domain-containing protein [Microbacterium sp.]|uniref:muramidase family protein n=1 Tax=Microbacterium sp. TaxID=51671 RepID=UPI003A95C781